MISILKNYNFKRREENLLFAIRKFTSLLAVSVSNAAIDRLRTDPEYPSIATFASAFEAWGIPFAIREVNVSDLKQAPLPFVAHVHDNGGAFCIVTQVDDHYVRLITQKKTESIPLANFDQRWTQVCLFAFPNEKSGEHEFAQRSKQGKEERHRRRMLHALAGLCAVCIALTLFHVENTIVLFSFGLKTIGLVGSVFLFMAVLKQKPRWLENFCRGTATDDGCEKIAETEGPFGISWAEVGMVYFAAAIFVVLNFGASASHVNALNLISVLAALFSVYSIYVQFRQKTWCMLCLVVQAVLLTDCVMALTSLNKNDTSTAAAAQVLLPYFLFGGSWLVIREILVKAIKSDGLEKSLNELKRRPSVFESITRQSRSVPAVNVKAPFLIYKEADIRLTMVTSLSCEACKSAYPYIFRLLDTFDATLGVEIILRPAETTKNEELSLIRNRYAHPTLSVRDLEKLLSNQDASTDSMSEEFVHERLKYKDWCESADIQATPQFFINGKAIPLNYSIDDIDYHLRHLLHERETIQA
jgi:uncharacterized membrane protein